METLCAYGQKTTWYIRRKKTPQFSALGIIEKDRQTERKREDGEGGGEEKMKGYAPLQQEEVGLEGGERRRKNKREDSWVIAAVHHFRVAVNGRQPLLC